MLDNRAVAQSSVDAYTVDYTVNRKTHHLIFVDNSDNP